MNLQRLRNDLIAIVLLGVVVFLGMSLFSFDPADPPSDQIYPARDHVGNLAGEFGAAVARSLRTSFGWGAYLFWGLVFVIDVRLFCRRPLNDWPARVMGATLMLSSVCIGLQAAGAAWDTGTVIGTGGYLGAYGLPLMQNNFRPEGLMVILGSLFLAGVLMSSDTISRGLAYNILHLPQGVFEKAPPPREKKVAPVKLDALVFTTDTAEAPPLPVPKPAKKKISFFNVGSKAEPEASPLKYEPVAAVVQTETVETQESSERQPRPIRINPPRSGSSAPLVTYSSTDEDDYEHPLPTPDLLDEAEEFPYELLAEKAKLAAGILERTFKEFSLNVRVVEIDTGPVVTQFELELEAGLRLSKVSALADDLAIALRVPSVRVVAPIPGKNTVGVEVPNDKQVMVRLRELIESCNEEAAAQRIPIFLGKDVTGRPLVVDLTKMPHLLIAGRTGTGKSVCLNTLILSILMTRTPEQVRMLMIDPKMVELSPYTRIPHLMNPVITDMKKAEAVLAWAVDKMEERYDLLARCRVRHLDNYNKLGKREILKRLGIEDEEEADAVPETMPYIVIIADEMADMMMTSGKDVEGHIIRLAQKSRAVGIHLVLATQKPTVDVITGLIKSNLPARISFQVASRTDSRVVLDEMGADKLLGNGDMLYLAPGTSNLTRAQGTYVSDDEVNLIIEFYGDQEPQYSRELAQLGSGSAKGKSGIEALRARDEMYEQAIEVVIREGRGSVSLLQRCLGIGYGRAARLVDYMAEDGIVGDYNGSQAREVLYTLEQWQALVRGESPDDFD